MNSTRSIFLIILGGHILTSAARALDVPVAADAHVLQSNPTFNYGVSVNLGIYSTAGSQRYSYLRFSPEVYFPPDYGSADISQALLHLYVNTVTTAGSFSIYRVTGDWVEGTANGAAQTGTITWNTRPADSGVSLATVSVAASDFSQFITLDVTDLAKDWIDNPSQNFGILFKTSGTIVTIMDSKENITTAHGPKIDITFKTKRVNPGGDVSMGTFTNGPQP